MPNRILKESIRTSPEIDQLNYFQECMFYRLIVSADDFGRYYGDPVLLKSFLFPRKEDVKAAEIDEALQIMNKLGLITLYLDAKGDRYLFFTSWKKHQQQRSNKSKFPDPVQNATANDSNLKSDDGNLISDDINCLQVDSKCPRKRERERERERDRKSETRTRTTTRVDEVDGDDLHLIQQDHNEILDAAEDAGFPNNQATYDMIIELYSDYGKESVLNGIRACVEQGKTSVAYLKGCCKNTGKSATGGRRNPFDSMIEGVAQ